MLITTRMTSCDFHVYYVHVVCHFVRYGAEVPVEFHTVISSTPCGFGFLPAAEIDSSPPHCFLAIVLPLSLALCSSVVNSK